MSTGTRRFWAVLGLILLASTALRVTYVVTVTRHDVDDIYDAFYYTLQARELARGEGFIDPIAAFEGRAPGPAADHPPLLAVVLIPAAAIPDSDTSIFMMRITVMLFGLGAVAMTGVLGRVLAGDRVGWVAAAIAGLSPNFWMNDGIIMSESLAVFLTALALWCTYRARSGATWRRFAVLGAVCGLAALTRAELALLAPVLILPVALRHNPWRIALVKVASGAAAACLVVVPWIAYNQSRFESRVWLSTNDGIALAGSNCDTVYYGRRLGYTELGCLSPFPSGDQSEKSDVWRDRALDYVHSHTRRLPAVVAARVLRTWQVWDPFEHARYNIGEGRPFWASTLGIVTMWVLFPLVIAGLVVSRRRQFVIWPLLVPIGLVTLSSALIFGQVRFRAPAEPSLAVLGAIGIVALAGRYRPSWGLSAADDESTMPSPELSAP